MLSKIPKENATDRRGRRGELWSGKNGKSTRGWSRIQCRWPETERTWSTREDKKMWWEQEQTGWEQWWMWKGWCLLSSGDSSNFSQGMIWAWTRAAHSWEKHVWAQRSNWQSKKQQVWIDTGLRREDMKVSRNLYSCLGQHTSWSSLEIQYY